MLHLRSPNCTASPCLTGGYERYVHVLHGRAIFWALLASAAYAPAYAQEEQAPADAWSDIDEELAEDDSMIVVTGQRERGEVIGDIPPEIQLDPRDIRATGASDVSELLEAIAPQTGSGRGRGGGRPIILLNGRRISGFSEIRNLPTEAIVRVDIFPEEVALKYGYRADQRVVNFVLRERFRAITAEIEGGLATAGGRESYEADVNILRITGAGRWSLDAEYEHQAPLFESERNIVQADPDALLDDGDFRTLLAESDEASLNGTINRNILTDVSATLNAQFEASSSRSFLGLPPSGGTDPLTRDTDSWTGHLGTVLNGDIVPWRWSITGNYDHNERETLSDTGTGRDRATTVSDLANVEMVGNGPLFDLPAGEVSSSFRAGAEYRGFSSETTRGGALQARDLSRRRGTFQGNVDVPIASRREGVLDAIGDLSLNANAELEWLSDFGTLRTFGYGLNWSPIEELRIIASVTDEDGAPSMQQLGDPVLLTPNVRVFDFLRGETVDINRLEGGSPALLADNRRVMKLGATARLLDDGDLTLRADYTSSRTVNPIASFPTATPEIEAAFPDRFTRDADGRLIRIDSRPVNFARADREELRWGINFSKSIGEETPRGEPRRRAERGGQTGRRGAAGETPPSGERPASTSAEGQPPQTGQRGGGGGRGRGGFGRFGGGRGGGAARLQLGLFHTWRFKDEILIREGVPVLDLLGGSATGSRGGQSRHQVEFQAGIFKNGLGARLSADWQSGTFIRGGPDGLGGTRGDLFFDDFATVDLRLFANLGQQRALVQRHPFLRGTRVSLRIDNLFDSRLSVRDETGATPLGYQPDLIDPLGRSVRLSVRKLFF